MAANKETVESWIKEGIRKDKDFLLSVCDTYDHSDYPVYCSQKSLESNKKKYSGNMQWINEVIDLRVENKMVPAKCQSCGTEVMVEKYGQYFGILCSSCSKPKSYTLSKKEPYSKAPFKFPELDGCEFFLCGGAVRDHLLDKKNKDEDYVVITDMKFDELVAAIEANGGKVFEAKKEFLTIRCKYQGRVIDIVYPRVEAGYSDFRHPSSVKSVSSLEEDSSRRDFKINAMYMNANGTIIDYHGGQANLKSKILYTVGKAEDRFCEDALRMLRAIR